MNTHILSPLDPALAPMLTLQLHGSLVSGLQAATGVSFAGPTLDADAAEQLDAWANSSDNPTGQRADLARAIAGLIRAGNGANVGELPSNAPRGFWEVVSA